MCAEARPENVREKVGRALARLQRILPLQQRQQQCPPDIRRLHRAILRAFVEKGRPLNLEEMRSLVEDPGRALSELNARDMITLDEKGEISGAYPFSGEPREHRLAVNGQRLYAMCALDALAVASMFDTRVQIQSQCRQTQAPLAIRLDGRRLENPEEALDVCVGIDWGAAADSVSGCNSSNNKGNCADSLCLQMIYLKDRAVAEQWLAQNRQSREIFTLPQAISFAGLFFDPLLAQPWGTSD